MTTFPGYSQAPGGGSAPKTPADAAGAGWVRQIVDVVNRILSGKLNAVTQITLRASQVTTTVIDSRIGPFSGLYLQPLTSHAAADLYSATSVLADQTTQKAGSVVFDHPNSASTDKTFNLLIIG